jgi:hypothetical protein
MNLANQEFEASAEQYRLLARKSINQADLEKYVRRVLKVNDEEKPSTRTKNIMEKITRLFDEGRGNNLPSVRGTMWAGYNSFAEYLSYQRGHNSDTRLNSLWFGDSANLNKYALEVALDMAA